MFQSWRPLSSFICRFPSWRPRLPSTASTLGWAGKWREGDHTVSLAMPGVDVQLMVDVDPERVNRPGAMLVVDDAREWIERTAG